MTTLQDDSVLDATSLVISFGNSSLSKSYISLNNVQSEGFTISISNYKSNSTLIVCNGAPINKKDKKTINML